MPNPVPDAAVEDAPYRLRDGAERACRAGMLTLPHTRPLTDFLRPVADTQGAEYHMPHFDPCDGGVHARANL